MTWKFLINIHFISLTFIHAKQNGGKLRQLLLRPLTKLCGKVQKICWSQHSGLSQILYLFVSFKHEIFCSAQILQWPTADGHIPNKMTRHQSTLGMPIVELHKNTLESATTDLAYKSSSDSSGMGDIEILGLSALLNWVEQRIFFLFRSNIVSVQSDWKWMRLPERNDTNLNFNDFTSLEYCLSNKISFKKNKSHLSII